MNNGLRIFKSKINQQFIYLDLRYSSYIFKQNIEILNSNLTNNEPIDGKLFKKLVKEIEINRVCDRQSSLILLKSCGLNYIDKFPFQRQPIADYLFYNLFREMDFGYQSPHYEAYMSTTISNQCSFDPYKMLNLISAQGLVLNHGMILNLITQLCHQNKINQALFLVSRVIKNENFVFDFDKFENYLPDSEQDKILKDHLKFEQIELINPIIYFYLKTNDLTKSSKLIEILESKFSKLSRSTICSVLKGNLISSNYVKALDILNRDSNFLSKDLLELYYITTFDINFSKNEFYHQLVKIIRQTVSPKDLIYVIDLINRLTSEKKIDSVVEILKICDQYEFGFNLNEYFMKSIIEYENEFKSLNKVVNLHGDRVENLENLLKFSLAKKDTENSLKIISELKNNQEVIKPEYFYPILDKESAELVTNLKNSRKKIEMCLNYKRIDSILKKIRFDFNVLMKKDDLKKIIQIFRNNDTNYLVKFEDICRLFDNNQIYSTLTLFNVSSDIILENQLRHIDQNRLEKNYNLDASSVYQVFADIHNLIISLNISYFNEAFLNKLNRYLTKLYATNLSLIDFDGNNKIMETLKLINQRYGHNDDNLINDINKTFKEYCIRSTPSGIDPVLMYKIVENSLQRNPGSKHGEFISQKKSEYSSKSESIHELMNLIEELESKEKNVYSSVRRLLMRLCYSEELDNPIEMIENYSKKLPVDQFTPKLCHDLMIFYAHRTFDFDKSLFYLEQLKFFAINKDKFQPDAVKFINVCEILFRAKKIKSSDLEVIFKTFKWTSANNDKSSLAKINEFLNGQVFTILSPFEYKNLVENLFESNIISRNTCFASMVLLKFIESDLVDEAFSYFKYNLVEHKTSVGEVFILKTYFKQYEKKLLVGTKLEELMLIFSEFYSSSLGFNFMFYAHCMNGDFYSASAIYNQNLDKTLDLNILERLVDQIKTNRLNKKHSRELKKLLMFKNLDKNPNLKKKIKNILNKFS